MNQLKEIRNELLRLHKTLLEIEKGNYEAEYGKTAPNELFQLLFNNERFIWLRTISSLVVDIDEAYASKEGIDEELLGRLKQQAFALFDESEDHGDFKAKYKANLDTESEVAFHHVKLLKLFAK